MLVKTLLGLDVGVLNHNLGGLEEVVESHGAVLLVLRLTKERTFCDDLGNNFLGGLCALELGLLLGLFLGDDDAAEALKFLVVLQIVVSRSLSEMGKVELELCGEGVGSLAHFDGLDLGLGLGRGGELEGLKLAEHLHVSLELKLGSGDDYILGLGDLSGLKGHADLGVLLLDLLSLGVVFHVLLDGELVVLGLKLDPLASLPGDGHDRLLIFHLSFAEDLDVFGLVLLTESGELSIVELSSLGSKRATTLTGDDSAEHDEILVLKGAVDSGSEFAMGVHSLAHSELWVLVFWSGVFLLLASPQVAEHFLRCVIRVKNVNGFTLLFYLNRCIFLLRVRFCYENFKSALPQLA